jgi:hypothetical protein
MAKRDGWSSIYQASRVICRMVGKYGTARIAAHSTPEFQAAVFALAGACLAFEALDDYPSQIDQTLPTGVEDEPPAEG